MTNGRAIGIHPVFDRAFDGTPRVAEFQAELLDLLEKYCDESRYFFTAVMFTDASFSADNARLERWVWQQGNVSHSPTGAIELRFGGIPGFPAELKEQTLTATRDRRDGAEVTPPSTLPATGVRNAAIEAILASSANIDPGALPVAVDATDRLKRTPTLSSCKPTTVSAAMSPPRRASSLPIPSPTSR